MALAQKVGAAQAARLHQDVHFVQYEGSFHLDDIRHLQDDEALRTLLALDKLPRVTTLSDWLRRMGGQPQIRDAWMKVN